MLTNNEANMEVIELDKKAKKKGYTHSGHLSAKGVSIEHRPTFADVSILQCLRFLLPGRLFSGAESMRCPVNLHINRRRKIFLSVVVAPCKSFLCCSARHVALVPLTPYLPPR
jgi:hypothetical protein